MRKSEAAEVRDFLKHIQSRLPAHGAKVLNKDLTISINHYQGLCE